MVVIVGAGTTGCVLAARLSENPTRHVRLLDAGGPEVERSDRVQLPAHDHPGLAWYNARLGATDLGLDGRTELVRGERLGGSAEVNGGYFLHPRRTDVEQWYPGAPGWGWDVVSAAMRRCEHDHVHDTSSRDSDGTIQVTHGPDRDPSEVEAAFVRAATDAGHQLIWNMNGSADLGVGPVAQNVVDGRRSTPANTFLAAARGRPNLEVLQGTRAERIVFDGHRCVGLAIRNSDGERVISADSVIICAGAIESAALLMRSGIGPADVLGAAGVDVVVDRPEIGASISEHPAVELPFIATVPPGPDAAYLGWGLHFEVGGTNSGDHLARRGHAPRVAEVLLSGQSYGRLTGTDPDDLRQVLRVALMQPRSVGSLGITGPSSDDPLAIDLGLLGADGDIEDLVDAVRHVAALARSTAMADATQNWFGPDEATVGSESALARWVRDHLTSCQHLSGSVPMGHNGALDALLAVRDVHGVHVADISALPGVPSRGTCATAVLLGEHAAQVLGSVVM